VIRPGISQEELAHQAGGTRQSVNAALRGFERRGWIETRDRAVTLKQPGPLSRFAGAWRSPLRVCVSGRRLGDPLLARCQARALECTRGDVRELRRVPGSGRPVLW
jgi:DNA-binding transcriptional MocR family regulator